MSIKNKLLTTEYITSYLSSIDISSRSMQTSFYSMFDTANILYNEASIAEDSITNSFLDMIGELSSIKFSYNENQSTFIENFKSLNFIDRDYHIDIPLTIDTNSGDLFLPVTSTSNVAIVALKLEPDSNGSPGNALNSFANNDLNAILDDSSNSLFEYERYGSAFSSTPLTLTLNLTTDLVRPTSSLFIKLYSEDGSNYPIIETLQISSDGLTYQDIPFTYEDNQNDYYIRYQELLTKYIKITFYQSTPFSISTNFGIKLKYSICIRNIYIQSVQYSNLGDYISVPLSSGSPIKKVQFSSSDKSNNDIGYFISANNGGKWLPILNGQTLDLLKEQTGLPFAFDIQSIRVKIAMRRSSSPNLTSFKETIPMISGSDFFLRYTPIEFTAFLGGFMSFGDAKKVQYQLPQRSFDNSDPSCILSTPFSIVLKYVKYYDGIENDLNLYLNGELLINNKDTNYIVTQHANPLHSNLLLNFSSTSNFGVSPGGMLEINFKPFVYSAGSATGQTINLPLPSLYKDTSSITVQSVPTTLIPGVIPSDMFAGNDPPLYCYILTPVDTTTFRDWSIEGNIFETNDPVVLDKVYNYEWKDIDGNDQTVAMFYFSNANCEYRDSLVLKDSNGDIIDSSLYSIQYYFSNPLERKTLLPTDFVISDDLSSLVINLDAYNSSTDYLISYYHSLDITSLIQNDLSSNQLSANGVNDTPQDSKVTFSYTYQDNSTISNINYYTPLCKQYTVTLT